NEEDVIGLVDKAVKTFGGIDAVLNNASAIDLSPVGKLPLKSYDLMLDINARGTFTLISAALPHPKQSDNQHVLTLAPPLNPDPVWLHQPATFSLCQYAMTMLTLGLAGQEHPRPLAANCLWPRTTIATAAVQN